MIALLWLLGLLLGAIGHATDNITLAGIGGLTLLFGVIVTYDRIRWG